jgi:hypothetical protein
VLGARRFEPLTSSAARIARRDAHFASCRPMPTSSVATVSHPFICRAAHLHPSSIGRCNEPVRFRAIDPHQDAALALAAIECFRRSGRRARRTSSARSGSSASRRFAVEELMDPFGELLLAGHRAIVHHRHVMVFPSRDDAVPLGFTTFRANPGGNPVSRIRVDRLTMWMTS